MTIKIDTKFEGKLNCAYKNDMRNLANFHQNTWKPQNWNLDGIFYAKLKMYELKIYRGIMCHDNEEWYKTWRGIDLSIQKWHEEFDKFWPEHLKISKICTLMGFFWTKYIVFELKKNREGLYLMARKIDAKFERKLTCAFEKFSFTGWKIAISF